MNTLGAEKNRPFVGVASIVWQTVDKKRLLLGLGHDPSNRRSIYAMPGGHWESGETLIEAARREIREEAGIEISNIKFLSIYEFFHAEKQKTYLSVWFEAIWDGGTPSIREPENKSTWGWYTPEEALALPLWYLDRVLIKRAMAQEAYGYPDGLPVVSFKPTQVETV